MVRLCHRTSCVPCSFDPNTSYCMGLLLHGWFSLCVACKDDDEEDNPLSAFGVESREVLMEAPSSSLVSTILIALHVCFTCGKDCSCTLHCVACVQVTPLLHQHPVKVVKVVARYVCHSFLWNYTLIMFRPHFGCSGDSTQRTCPR